MAKTLLFSVTANDCRFDYFRGSGKGGQKRNKTSSGVRCTHKDSGAVGVSDDTRSQHDNKKIAFQRMTESGTFKEWHKLEIAKHTGAEIAAREYADKEVENSLVEIKVNGKWTDEKYLLTRNSD